MDKLRIVPAPEYSEEVIKYTSLVNAVSVAGHPVTISSMNDSRVIPAIPAVFDQYVIPIISIRTPSPEDIFIPLDGRELEGGKGDGSEADRRRSP
jgi:hypothetical protein